MDWIAYTQPFARPIHPHNPRHYWISTYFKRGEVLEKPKNFWDTILPHASVFVKGIDLRLLHIVTMIDCKQM